MPAGVGLLCGYNPGKESSGDYLVSSKRAADFILVLTAEMKLSGEETRALAYMLEALPALAICVFTAGTLSIMWIYAMANCATGIAYIVIGLCELMLIAGILAGVATG